MAPEPGGSDPQTTPEQHTKELTPPAQINSLRELIDLVSGRSVGYELPQEDAGLADITPFPFLALVGQLEMKIALLLAVINPTIGGVLLIGPRGTGKTTAVRSLLNLLPQVERSACFYGCLPEDIKNGGIDAVCPNCARKFAEGQPLTITDQARLVELPLNATLDDVIGWIDERAANHERFARKRGILAQADQSILYIDETNLLVADIADAILDAAANGVYAVRRGPLSATYRARFTLIGSMNPEEGTLRPQLMDRFGLRIILQGLSEPVHRLEAYRRTHLYRANPHHIISLFDAETSLARHEIQSARQALPGVELPETIALAGIRLIQELQIDSLRAEIALFESARAYAAADARGRVELTDLRTVAPLALRMRHSDFMAHFRNEYVQEEHCLTEIIDRILS